MKRSLLLLLVLVACGDEEFGQVDQLTEARLPGDNLTCTTVGEGNVSIDVKGLIAGFDIASPAVRDVLVLDNETLLKRGYSTPNGTVGFDKRRGAVRGFDLVLSFHGDIDKEFVIEGYIMPGRMPAGGYPGTLTTDAMTYAVRCVR